MSAKTQSKANLAEKNEVKEGDIPISKMSDEQLHEKGILIACTNLEKRGYELKFDCSGRVFDVVAMDKDTAVLISVSARRVSKTSNEFPPLDITPEMVVDFKRALDLYMLTHPYVDNARFDAISINMFDDNLTVGLRHLIGAADVSRD